MGLNYFFFILFCCLISFSLVFVSLEANSFFSLKESSSKVVLEKDYLSSGYMVNPNNLNTKTEYLTFEEIDLDG